MRRGTTLKCPRILALFQKRIEGDDALLGLASLRFREAGLGAEFYAESPEELEWLLGFLPFPGAPAVVHLRRGGDLFDEADRKMIIEFARRFGNRIFGMVFHDQIEIVERFEEYAGLLREMDSRLDKIGNAPLLFIEYAAGLEPELFTKLFREIRGLARVSACIDTGHLGLWQVSNAYAKSHPKEDIFSLSPEDSRLPDEIEDVQRAVSSALETVLHVGREICGFGKPVHFHLHDGHPLSKVSHFGISDHLSFLERIPVPFAYKGGKRLDPMFGPAGLKKIFDEALRTAGPDRASFTLEIHPVEGKLPLGHASYLFRHWRDKGNAERMNFWLSVFRENHNLISYPCREREVHMREKKGMIIYNLFPLLAGKFTEWESHLSRASGMGFTWVFVNPIQLPGSSGSIYSIKDYFSFNPVLVDQKSDMPAEEQVKEAIRTAGKFGLKMMVDLVINHCAADSALIKSHRRWFVRAPNGRVAHPFADENGKKVVWKDLAKFDHRNSKDKEGLFRFFLDVVKFLAGLGFKGFRCDAAYQIPGSLWTRLIKEARKSYPGLLFFAETLGTTPDLTRKTAAAGFDYIFNSSKWWDLESKWLMQQYNLTREISPSIAFPESHDTVRLCEELKGNIAGLKQRYLFSALFSAGVMMPIGFEFGFRKKLHVVKTRTEDWEETGIDLTSFIATVNRTKAGHVIFQEDAPTEILHNPNKRVMFMWKASTHNRDECLIILNKDTGNRQRFEEENLKDCLQAGAPLVDISPEARLEYIPKPFSYELDPGQGIVLITARDEVPED